MSLTAAQIVTLACQIAKAPGFTSQAGQWLNAVLSDLCQDYDFNVIRKNHTFNFSTSASGLGYAPGSGPNVMPSDFLRAYRNGSFYKISQVPYPMIGCKQEEFDRFVQQAGLASYPYMFYVDVSTAPAGLYVWPPASGAYPVTVRYQPQMADIATPETSTTVPWFPNTNYLITRVAGEVMKITNDDRWQAFLSDAEDSGGAGDVLRKYLKMKDDPETAVNTVKLDRRLFGASMDRLRDTKQIGW